MKPTKRYSEKFCDLPDLEVPKMIGEPLDVRKPRESIKESEDKNEDN